MRVLEFLVNARYGVCIPLSDRFERRMLGEAFVCTYGDGIDWSVIGKVYVEL